MSALAATLLTACFTGSRPTFAPAAPTVSDPAMSAVLKLLDAPSDGPFTAQYSILTKFGNITTSATVTQLGPGQKSITIGTVRFIFDTAGAQTCNLVLGSCEPGTIDQRVSDLSLTHEFFSAAPAARLRQDAYTMTTVPTASTESIGGQPATCVTIPIPAGSKVYCALANGVLARQDTPDLRIDLLGIGFAADASLMSATTVAG